MVDTNLTYNLLKVNFMALLCFYFLDTLWILIFLVINTFFLQSYISRSIESFYDQLKKTETFKNIKEAKRLLIVSEFGGCGKTTLAKRLFDEVDGITNMFSIDNFVYIQPGWKRRTEEEFKDYASKTLPSDGKISSCSPFIIEGVCCEDPKLKEKRTLWTNMANHDSSVIVYMDIPFWMTICNKFMRSVKRKLGLEVGPKESYINIWNMMKKSWFKKNGAEKVEVKRWLGTLKGKVIQLSC